MGHVAEDVSSIAHDFMSGMSFDVTDEPDTTHFSGEVRDRWSFNCEDELLLMENFRSIGTYSVERERIRERLSRRSVVF